MTADLAAKPTSEPLPEYLRQIADELDEGRDSPCSEASICRDAAAEIEMWRTREASVKLCQCAT